MKQSKQGSKDAPLGDIAIVEGGSAAIVSMSSKLQPNKKEPAPKKKSGNINKSKAAQLKNGNSKAEPTKNSGALARQSSGSTASTSASSKKKRGTSKAEPPFPFYRDVSKATVSEGFESIVNLLRGRKNIVVLTGAGISVSCGIPDFRSRGSGLYSTLDTQELGLTCPEDLFDWEMFQEDPRPFYKFARNLYFPLGCGDSTQRVRPSDSHKLLALLEQKKMLLRVYSQNIDGLEQVAGVSQKKMVYAHGSLQWATCCRCKHKVTAKEIEPSILERSVPLCQEPIQGRRNGSPISSSSGRGGTSPLPQLQPPRGRKRPRHLSDEFEPKQEEGKPMTCNGVLKPGVTFFGEALNDTVRRNLESDRNKVDALIVIGTSLSVAPISKVIGYLPGNIPRILINRAIVHPPKSNVEASDDNDSDDDEERDFREDYVFDAYLLGYCDDVTRLLAKKLFSTDTRDGEGDKPEQSQTFCQLLSTVRERSSNKAELDGAASENGENDDADDEHIVEPEMFKAEDWAFCKVPEERVVLFHGAEPSVGSGYGDDGEEDANSEVTFREVAQCDGCSKRIEGIIQKCVDCFDYDLCQKCYPKVSKTHYNGEHVFAAEPAAVVDATCYLIR